jgi:hypothetical protein
MPVNLTRFETGKVVSGESSAISRRLDDSVGPVFKAGDKVMLTSRFIKPGEVESTPVAEATITGVTVESLSVRKEDKLAAIREGFDDGNAFYRHFIQLYGDCNDHSRVVRAQFRIERMLLPKA